MGMKTDAHDSEAEIARLLRAAGRGPTASDDARSRIYSAVQSEWRRSTRSAPIHVHAGRQTDTSTRAWTFWFARALPAATIVAAVVLGVRLLDTPVAPPAAEVATLTKTMGAVELLANDRSAAAQVRTAIRSGDVVRTASDGGASMTLSNGIVLRIDANTELLLAAGDRVELRRGTAYVDSGPSPDSMDPLELETPFGTLSHIGTQYETRVGTNNLRVRIREGIVIYTTETPTGDTLDTRGTAGEQLLAIVGDGEIQRSAIALTGPEWAWVENLATAPAGDLHAVDELLEWVARETGRELRFADGTVAARARGETIVGAAGLDPEETLGVIAQSTGFDVAQTDIELLVR